jgi:hypothetical protein
MVPVLALFGGMTQLFARDGSDRPETARRPDTATLDDRGSVATYMPLIKEVSVEPLRAIETRVLRQPVVPGPWSHATLPEYYWAENEELLGRFHQAKQAFDQTPVPAYRGLTLVAGAAGVGKTFLKKEVFKKDYPKSAVHKCDMRELFQMWADKGLCEPKADLASGPVALNHLLAIRDKSTPYLRDYLEANSSSRFFVIDSLDEIHPDDYVPMLQQIHEFATSPRRTFAHVVVFGRGVAFREYWRLPRPARQAENVKLFLLNPPSLRTTGDLTVSSWNYHSWKYDLSWAPHGGAPQPMPLADYRDWLKTGFGREGAFASVTSEANSSMRHDVQRTLVDWASRYRVVASTLDNLAGNSLMREIIEREVLAGRPYDERRIMSAYFESWLVRDTKSDGRPSKEKPEHLDLYLYLLQQVAARHLHNRQVDQHGFFPVRNSDRIVVAEDGKQLAFPVMDILDRSGLKFIDPRERGVRRYRFEPIWIHRLLVDMHNEQCRKSG